MSLLQQPRQREQSWPPTSAAPQPRTRARERRQTAQRMLRALRLLPLYDAISLGIAWLRCRQPNIAFRRAFPDFPVPPIALSYDAYGHIQSHVYRQTGEVHAAYIAGLILRHRGHEPLRLLEFGCGPARVIRHLPRLFPPPTQILGSDYNPRTIRWCQQNIPGIRFLENHLRPPLALPPESIDCVYCLSVFTHLSEEMQWAWRDELLRVLRPGGLLILTTHGTSYRDSILSTAERARYDAGQIITRGNVRQGKKYFVTHQSPNYMRTKLLSGLEVIEFQAGGIGQDVWVVRKRMTNE